MTNSSRPSSAVALSKTGKPLFGTAAQLRIAALAGGHDRYHSTLMERAASDAVEKLWFRVVTHFVLTPYQETQSTQGAEEPTTRNDGTSAQAYSMPQDNGGLKNAKH